MNSHVLSPHNRTAFCTRHEKDNYIIQGLVLLSRRPVRWRNEKERNVWIVNRLCPAPLPASACVDVTINPEAVSLFLGQDSSQTPSLLLSLSWAAEGRAERGERQTWEVHSDLRYRHQQQKRVRSPTCWPGVKPIKTVVCFSSCAVTAEDMEGKTEEEIEMMKTMGFGSFDTTKVSATVSCHTTTRRRCWPRWVQLRLIQSCKCYFFFQIMFHYFMN